MAISIILIILGFILLIKGADLLVDGSSEIAKRFHIPEIIIGLTIVSIGTSMPELFVSSASASNGSPDMAIGNIIGSNIFNMLLIIGVSAFIHPIAYNVSYNIDLSILVGSLIVLALFPIIPPKNEMSRANGAIYFVAYIGYIILLFNI